MEIIVDILVRCKFLANENISFNYSGNKFEWTTLRDIQSDTSFKSRSGQETLAANKRPSGQYAHQETILGVSDPHIYIRQLSTWIPNWYFSFKSWNGCSSGRLWLQKLRLRIPLRAGKNELA